MQSCEHDIEHFDEVLSNGASKKLYIDIAKDKAKLYKEGNIFYYNYVLDNKDK